MIKNNNADIDHYHLCRAYSMLGTLLSTYISSFVCRDNPVMWGPWVLISRHFVGEGAEAQRVHER